MILALLATSRLNLDPWECSSPHHYHLQIPGLCIDLSWKDLAWNSAGFSDAPFSVVPLI